MEYSVEKDLVKWESKTRSGISLEFDKEQLIELSIKRDQNKDPELIRQLEELEVDNIVCDDKLKEFKRE